MALEIEFLSVKFQLCEAQRRLFNDELRRRQTPCYDFIRILVIIYYVLYSRFFLSSFNLFYELKKLVGKYNLYYFS